MDQRDHSFTEFAHQGHCHNCIQAMRQLLTCEKCFMHFGKNLIQLLLSQFNGQLESLNSGSMPTMAMPTVNYSRNALRPDYLNTPLQVREETKLSALDTTNQRLNKTENNLRIMLETSQISNQDSKNSYRFGISENKDKIDDSSSSSIFDRKQEAQLGVPRPNARKLSETTISVNKLTTLDKVKSLPKKQLKKVRAKTPLSLSKLKSSSRANVIKKSLSLLKMNFARRLGATPDMVKKIEQESSQSLKPKRIKIRRYNSHTDFDGKKGEKNGCENSSQETTAINNQHNLPAINTKKEKIKILKNQKTIRHNKTSVMQEYADQTPTFPPEHKPKEESELCKRDSNPQIPPRAQPQTIKQLKKTINDQNNIKVLSQSSCSPSKKAILRRKKSRIIQLRKTIKEKERTEDRKE
ncbi:unnamed protein product [Moneuplotes crassus]|uniref:Uncharacterized protein n=1 Tax=Euplotes crassus TaxID=5936 RepID=A0AAD1Y868_EUPCR|nr:unnamed protein product [Moneuplotes crassus]